MDHSNPQYGRDVVRIDGETMDYDGGEDTGGSVEGLRVLVEKEGRSIVNHMELSGYRVDGVSPHPDMQRPIWWIRRISWRDPWETHDYPSSVAVAFTLNQGWLFWEQTRIHSMKSAEEAMELVKLTLVAYEKGEDPWKEGS